MDFLFFLQLFFISALLSVATGDTSDAQRLVLSSTNGVRHSDGYCAMYGLCGKRADGKLLNCPYASPSLKPEGLLSSKIQSLCPTLTANVCCTPAQFDTLRAQVQQAVPFLVGCPACLRNFLNLFCELSCSPNQSSFVNVTSVAKVGSNLTVNGIDFHIDDAFGKGLYASCKDVKFGTMNTLAMAFIGGGAQNFKEWYAFIGKQAEPGVPGSPFALNFPSGTTGLSGMKPMNVSTYSCSDTLLGCSCGDCSSSPVCSGATRPSSHKQYSCSVKIGSLKAKCIEFALAVLYIILVSLFFGWVFFHRKKERKPDSEMKPSWNAMNGNQAPRQRLEDDPQIGNEIQLSIVKYICQDFTGDMEHGSLEILLSYYFQNVKEKVSRSTDCKECVEEGLL